MGKIGLLVKKVMLGDQQICAKTTNAQKILTSSLF